MSDVLVRVEMNRPRATFGFTFDHDTKVVTKAAPIAHYLVGWHVHEAISYLRSRGAKLGLMPR